MTPLSPHRALLQACGIPVTTCSVRDSTAVSIRQRQAGHGMHFTCSKALATAAARQHDAPARKHRNRDLQGRFFTRVRSVHISSPQRTTFSLLLEIIVSSRNRACLQLQLRGGPLGLCATAAAGTGTRERRHALTRTRSTVAVHNPAPRPGPAVITYDAPRIFDLATCACALAEYRDPRMRASFRPGRHSLDAAYRDTANSPRLMAQAQRSCKYLRMVHAADAFS